MKSLSVTTPRREGRNFIGPVSVLQPNYIQRPSLVSLFPPSVARMHKRDEGSNFLENREELQGMDIYIHIYRSETPWEMSSIRPGITRQKNSGSRNKVYVPGVIRAMKNEGENERSLHARL